MGCEVNDPLVYDGYCGLGGWSEGFLAAGYRCVGFDIEAHDYGSGGYPGELILRDMRQVHGSLLKDAACLVFSPPCQEYSYMAMPWERAKQIARALQGHGQFPAGYRGSRTIEQLNELFNTCYRIQREACEAACHYIPMVIENVCGAQKWVGRAKANYGSFYLWGDVGMVGNRVVCIVNGKLLGHSGVSPMKARKFNPDGTAHGTGSWFAIADSKERGANAEKVPGFRFDGSGGSFQSAAVKVAGMNWSDRDRPAQGFNVAAAQRYREGVKFSQSGDAWFDGKPRDKMLGDKGPAAYGSRSNSRKAASAMIAKIPFALSSHIARTFLEATP